MFIKPIKRVSPDFPFFLKFPDFSLTIFIFNPFFIFPDFQDSGHPVSMKLDIRFYILKEQNSLWSEGKRKISLAS